MACKKKNVTFRAPCTKADRADGTCKTGQGKKTVKFQRKCSTPGQLKKSRSTAHLRAYKQIVKAAAPQCGKRFGWFNKKYGACIRDAIRTSTPRASR